MTTPDFTFANHGSICTLQPVSAAAQEWVAEHIPADAQTWGSAIVIEPRYVSEVLSGISDDGLEVA